MRGGTKGTNHESARLNCDAAPGEDSQHANPVAGRSAQIKSNPTNQGQRETFDDECASDNAAEPIPRVAAHDTEASEQCAGGDEARSERAEDNHGPVQSSGRRPVLRWGECLFEKGKRPASASRERSQVPADFYYARQHGPSYGNSYVAGQLGRNTGLVKPIRASSGAVN